MTSNGKRSLRRQSIQTRMLLIILPLIISPMLALALIGFIATSREAASTSSRFLAEREADLRTIAESQTVADFNSYASFFSRVYGLSEESEEYRLKLEQYLQEVVENANSSGTVYTRARYLDDRGAEVAHAEDTARLDSDLSPDDAFVAKAFALKPDEILRSTKGLSMKYAMPVFDVSSKGIPRLQGVAVLYFQYPQREFGRTTNVIAVAFIIITAVSLAIAIVLIVRWVRRLTQPVRQLAEAADLIARGNLGTKVDIESSDEIGHLACSFNEMATSLDRNEQALKRKVAELTKLYEIGREITAQVTLRPILRLIVDSTRELLHAEATMLALRQDGSDQFEIQAQSGSFTPILAELRFRPGEGLGGAVVISGKAIIVDDYLVDFSDSPFIGVIKEAGLRSSVAVPLISQDVVVGVLYVASQMPHKFNEEHRALLDTFATQATISIENARLYQQVKNNAQELDVKVKARTQELLEANLKLEAASRHKSEFLANMSHELRTPLNSIIGFSDVLKRKLFGALNEKQEDYLDDIYTSGKHLLSLINDILDLSKVEAGKLELEMGAIDLREILENSLVIVKERALAHGIDLSLTLDDDIGIIEGDERKVKQVLFNLLSNAVKFTPDGGKVKLKARRPGDVVEIAVSDTGIGIAPDDQRRIFEEFQQADHKLSNKPEGTGLGLTLSRRFVELMGGKLWVDSTTDQGSTFTFTLPIRLETKHEPALPLEPGEMAEDSVAESSTEKTSILVVEDDDKAADLMRIYLSEAGYLVHRAADGAEAWDTLKKLSPAAVILDVLLPKVDGWTLLKRMQDDPGMCRIPVVMVSMLDQKGKGITLGAADFLVKPVSERQLLERLDSLIPKPGNGIEVPTILAIDDDPQALRLLDTALTPTEFRLIKATSGEEGLRLAGRERVDLIILDLLMPGLTGIDFVEQLAETASEKPPIIIYTIKELSSADKTRLHGHVAELARKGTFTRETFVGMVRDVLQRPLNVAGE